MPSFASLGKFFGRTASEGAAFAAGLATAPVLAPVVREIENEANAKYESHPLSAGDAAGIVAEDVEQYPFGVQEASYNGVNETRFKALLGEVLNAPGIGELYEAYRRDLIDDDTFLHGLRKAKLETLWDEPLIALKAQRLGPDVIARAIQRGLVADPGLLPVGPPTEVGKVQAFPVFAVDALTEAAAFGIDKDRLGVEVGLVGNPASPDLAARMTFREIIDRVDFDRAIAEGNTRNEWADSLFEGFRQILTAHDYTELELRGFSDRTQRLADTGKHGMSVEDSDKLYDVLGRAPSVHTVVIGLARGGKYPGSYANVPEPYKSAIQRSNIREEWSEIVYAARYTYPSGFQIRSEAQAGDMTLEETTAILLEVGWSPKWADFFAAKWTSKGIGTASTPASKAKTSALTALHKSYVNDLETDTSAAAILTALGIADAEQTATLDTWKIERSVIRKALTATQIKKSIGQPGHDQAWATDRLLELGYSAADAATFLAE